MSKENLILYDWFSFTAKHQTAESIINLLGMDSSTFETIRGMYGYMERLYFDGISVHFGGREDVWCEMSGQGCRIFESYGTGDWDALFDEVLSDKDYNVTRLDVAYDDHEGIFDLEVLKLEAERKNYISKMRWGKVEKALHDDGVTVYFGSPKSDIRFRIYDKARERGRVDEGHWVRFEMQLRDDNAYRFLGFSALKPIGELFAGVVNNYLRYVTPDECDTNKRRWETADYWFKFIHTIEKISLYEKPGTEYNLENLERYAVHQAGAAAALYVDIHGLDAFITKCAGKLNASSNQKYDALRRRHSGGNLAGVVPKPDVKELDTDKIITCESCGNSFLSKEFVFYDSKTNIGICCKCNLKDCGRDIES